MYRQGSAYDLYIQKINAIDVIIKIQANLTKPETAVHRYSAE